MHAEDEGVSLLRTTTIGEGSSGEGRRLMKMNIDSPAASPIDVSEIPQPMMATTPISADPIPSPPPAGFRVGVAGVDPHEYKVDWSKPMKSWMCTCLPYFLQLIMLACLGSFLFGFNLSLLNTSINHIAWEFRWCKYYTGDPIATCDEATIYKAFLSTSIFIGAAIGSLTGGVFLGFGRRGMMQISNVIFLLGIIGSCCAHSFSALLWARLCVGYGVGLISFIIPAYLSEITPSVKRGFYGVFHQLFVTIGILAGTVVGLPLPFKDPIPEPSIAAPDISAFSKVWWRVMLGLAFIPVLLSLYLLGTVYTFETPHYYLEKGHIADAKALYERLLDSDDVDSALEEANHEVEEGRKARLAGVSLSAALKHKEYRHVIIVGCLLAAFQQLSGVNVFMAQSNKLFIDAGLTGYMPTVMTVVMCLINCIMTLPAVPLIESLGRRTLLLAGCIGTLRLFNQYHHHSRNGTLCTTRNHNALDPRNIYSHDVALHCWLLNLHHQLCCELWSHPLGLPFRDLPTGDQRSSSRPSNSMQLNTK
eukprot:Protomagalhaensia_sp_Gyna_25__4007@NODE_360_length_3735_cov_83_099026_g264_i1_p2_GENE_NODE_360_length_3735_cov_83_099026_g264_i1NODE_360_length_3735_cov_83_099026_g264_i1_p2_ORF_typecomplete_len533_score77_21Sugar_tr/PF00083_24/1_1e65MFS_1/PF07690_16/1_2e02MFS_1/PF07690_16/1_4e16TRI12/PF06609_13/4_3e02TRI12/PF06609_13/1_2e05TRI12/PF06609_13/54MFS_3/PF05977_13/0_0052MFS_3/PF05977_13/1_5e02TPR_6/PF13174_6/0_19_NODE_360_length_3735_cov_83_099026_g264_i120793677